MRGIKGKPTPISTLNNIAEKNLLNNITKTIDSSKLIEHEDNEYLFGMEGIERLANEIKTVGFKGAIEVWDLKDGTYMIYSGARRNRANNSLGNTHIQAFVYDYPESEIERKRQLLGANIYGRNAVNASDPIHTARQMEYMAGIIKVERNIINDHDGKKTRDIIAVEFGTSPSSVQKYTSLLNLNERAQKAVLDGEIQLAQGSSMSILPSDQQDLVLDSLEYLRDVNGIIGRDEVQELVNFVKDFFKEHPNGVIDAEYIVKNLLEKWNQPTNVEFKPRKPEKTEEGSEEKVPERIVYSSKIAAKKFNHCYGKFEEFIKAEKNYKDQDKEEIKEKLQHLKELINAEIEKMEN